MSPQLAFLLGNEKRICDSGTPALESAGLFCTLHFAFPRKTFQALYVVRRLLNKRPLTCSAAPSGRLQLTVARELARLVETKSTFNSCLSSFREIPLISMFEKRIYNARTRFVCPRLVTIKYSSCVLLWFYFSGCIVRQGFFYFSPRRNYS